MLKFLVIFTGNEQIGCVIIHCHTNHASHYVWRCCEHLNTCVEPISASRGRGWSRRTAAPGAGGQEKVPAPDGRDAGHEAPSRGTNGQEQRVGEKTEKVVSLGLFFFFHVWHFTQCHYYNKYFFARGLMTWYKCMLNYWSDVTTFTDVASLFIH